MTKKRDGGRTRDAAATQRTILDAAEDLFAASGYDATSVQDISERAGVSRGTPGYFFGSKEQLYRAVLERAFAGARELVERIRSEVEERNLSTEEALEVAIDSYFDYLVEHPSFVRLVEWESLGRGRLLADLPMHVTSLREGVEILAESASPEGRHGISGIHLLIDMIALCWFPIAHGGTLLEGLGVAATDPAFLAERKKHVAAVLIASIRQGEEIR